MILKEKSNRERPFLSRFIVDGTYTFKYLQNLLLKEIIKEVYLMLEE